MLIDMHVHTSRYSACGKSSPEEIVAQAQAVGLDALVFTEHHIIWPLPELAALQARFPRIRLLSGVEIETSEGEDLLVYGVTGEGLLYRHMLAAQVIEIAQQHGGFAILAHPYRYKDQVAIDISGVDAVELMSIHILNYARPRIQQLVDAHHLLPMAASDAHHTSALGLYAIEVIKPAQDMPELIAALRQGDYHLWSDAARIRADNRVVRERLVEVQRRLAKGEDDGAIARGVPGYTAHMVHTVRQGLDFMHPAQ